MKRNNRNIIRVRIVAVAACAALSGTGVARAQDPGNGPNNGPGGPDSEQGAPQGQNGPGGRHGRPPLPPVIRALDTNHDGIIEADEIANAAKSLRTLETSGSDQLTIPQLLGPPPWMHRHGPGGPAQTSATQSGPQNGPPQGGSGDDQNGPPPGPPPGGPGDDQNGPPPGPPPEESGTNQNGPPPGPPPDESGTNQNGAPQRPPGGPGHHHRMPPVIWALDTNHDGIIESSEIDNAPQSLKKLDRRGTGQLTIPELLGPPPPRPRGGGQGEDGPPPPPPDDNGQGPNNGQNDGGQQPPPPPQ